MKSYINTLADYREADFKKEITVSCPDEYVEGQMKHLTRAFKKTEAANVIEKGDVTVLSLESRTERFNRPSVFVTVGGGLFHKEFEEKLIGHKTGETFEIIVDGEAVKVTVNQATRTVFPEPTDEMALKYAKEHDDFSGIKTVEDYKSIVVEKYIEQEKNNAIYEAMNQALDYVLTHSDWEFDEGEISDMVKSEKEYITEELKNEGRALEELSQNELSDAFGISELSELDGMLTGVCERQAAMGLWLAVNNGLDPKTASDEEINNCSWDFLEKFIRANVKIKEEK